MPETHTDIQIATALLRLGLFLRSENWQAARAAGLTPTQAEILAHLARRGPTRGAVLAEALGVTPATLSDSATALVAKGLAERHQDPSDARATLLHLTPDGVATISDMPEAPADLLGALRSATSRDRAALLRGLIAVIRSLQEARAIPVQRMCVTCRHFRPNVHAGATRPHHCAFVDADFGDADLRVDCGDHEEAEDRERARTWARFLDAA
jgi:DNA-binding MarR family transcriptional regulator